MVAPVRVRVSGQSAANGLLQGPDGAFYLSVGLTVTHSYPVVFNPEGLT